MEEQLRRELLALIRGEEVHQSYGGDVDKKPSKKNRRKPKESFPSDETITNRKKRRKKSDTQEPAATLENVVNEVKGGKKKKKKSAEDKWWEWEAPIKASNKEAPVNEPPRKKWKRNLSVESDDVSGRKPLNGRLAGARFRDLNERLYTLHSDVAFSEFTEDPHLFKQYHEGFRRQTDLWPESPLDLIKTLLQRPAFSTAKVADLGCGEAELAASLGDRVESFDLIDDDERGIRKCNINVSVPVPSETKDVVVLCLALMGTDCAGAIREAWRILRPNGLLLVAEVTSRFTSPEHFVQQLSKLGFKLLKFKDFGPRKGNTHFFLLPFQKGRSPDKSLVLDAKPCVYKKR